ncbi:MAG: potassium channel family protein [Puniceicoccales bacterium]
MTTFFITILQFFRGLRRAWEKPHFRSTLVVAFVIIVSGTVFYSRFEGWSLVDSCYFCVMTLATIGYGDLHPTNDITKIFTIFYAVLGIGIFVALVTQLAQAQIETREEHFKRKKKKKPKHLKNAQDSSATSAPDED